MKITLKKLLTGILCLVLCVSFAACGNGTNNKDNQTFTILQNWDKVGMKNHLNSGSNIGPLNWFSVESLVQYIRSTDEVFYVLAESIVHNSDSTSIINIRKDAKWHNGDDFKADDVIGYFYINQVEVTNYMLSLTKIDDKTVKITWKSNMEPNNRVKTLLLAVDRVGSVNYKEFELYIKEAKRILDASADMEEDYTGWAPFGKKASAADGSLYLANYTKFKAYNPSWFVATGPYKLDRMSETEMILKRNEDYWAVNNLGFEYIRAINSMSDLNQVYNMLSTGAIDYQDGLAPENTLEQILRVNPDMVHYKMNDPGSIGIVFNLSKKITVNGQEQDLWTDKVREAFQYIFDRETIKNSGNPYAITSYYPLMSMAPSEAVINMTEKYFNKLPQYSHNEAKAIALLQETGWTKTNSIWHYPNGTAVSLNLHYDGSHPGQSGAAVAVQSALSNFGITCILKRAADFNAWQGTAKSEGWSHDMSLTWTDLNMSFSFPTGSFIYCYKDMTAGVLHLPKNPNTGEEGAEDIPIEQRGQLALELEKADGSGTFRVADAIEGMYYLTDEKLKERVDDLVLGLAKKNYGVQFYQNVTGSFINKKVLGGLPLENYLNENNNISYIPQPNEDLENWQAVARLNFYFTYSAAFISGDLYPAE
jgi:peptide/nickel transport system substrate-binding protein